MERSKAACNRAPDCVASASMGLRTGVLDLSAVNAVQIDSQQARSQAMVLQAGEVSDARQTGSSVIQQNRRPTT